MESVKSLASVHAPSLCPQCGGRTPGGEPDRCPACGTEVGRPHAGWGQPRFERPGRGGGPIGKDPALWRLALDGVRAAGETAVSIALSPAAAFREFRFDGGITTPLAFSVLVGGPCLLLNVLLDARLSGAVVSPALALGLLFVLPPAYVYLRGHVLHLGLVLGGGARSSFAATLRVTAYANASVAPLLLLPFVGEFAFLVAGAMVEATGIRACHRLSLRGAVAAELAPAIALSASLLGTAFVGFLRWSQAQG